MIPYSSSSHTTGTPPGNTTGNTNNDNTNNDDNGTPWISQDNWGWPVYSGYYGGPGSSQTQTQTQTQTGSNNAPQFSDRFEVRHGVKLNGGAYTYKTLTLDEHETYSDCRNRCLREENQRCKGFTFEKMQYVQYWGQYHRPVSRPVCRLKGGSQLLQFTQPLYNEVYSYTSGRRLLR